MDERCLNVMKRPSGEGGAAGRGEYELSGFSNGYSASDIAGRRINIELFGHTFPTQVSLQKQGNKLRFRLQNPNDRLKKHLAPTVAALLLMPEPCRSEAKASHSYPVLQDSAYVLDLACELTEIDSKSATLAPRKINARSGGLKDSDYFSEIDVADRMRDLKEMMAAVVTRDIPSSLQDLIKRYESVIDNPNVDSYSNARSLTKIIMETLEASDEVYLPLSDPLPFLLNRLQCRNLTEEDVPSPEDMPKPKTNKAIKARERSERWYRRKEGRDAASRRFSDHVVAAYRGRCAICGAELPGVSLNGSGIDAAHILPWCAFDLDEVKNGIALCKNHHWAFDSRVLRIDCLDEEQGLYVLGKGEHYDDYRDGLRHGPGIFENDLGPEGKRYLNQEFLPEKPKERPAAEYLERFNGLYFD